MQPKCPWSPSQMSLPPPAPQTLKNPNNVTSWGGPCNVRGSQQRTEVDVCPQREGSGKMVRAQGRRERGRGGAARDARGGAGLPGTRGAGLPGTRRAGLRARLGTGPGDPVASSPLSFPLREEGSHLARPVFLKHRGDLWSHKWQSRPDRENWGQRGVRVWGGESLLLCLQIKVNENHHSHQSPPNPSQGALNTRGFSEPLLAPYTPLPANSPRKTTGIKIKLN